MKIQYILILFAIILSSCGSSKVVTGGGGKTGTEKPDDNKVGSSVMFDPELENFIIEYDNADKFETFDKVKSKKTDSKEDKSQESTPAKSINSELDKKLENIRYYNETIPKIKGYRILVYTGSDLDVAKSRENTLKMTYGQSMGKIDLEYVAPNYVLKYGKYYSRLKAHEIYTKLIEDFPSAIVVPEIITFDRSDFLVDEDK